MYYMNNVLPFNTFHIKVVISTYRHLQFYFSIPPIRFAKSYIGSPTFGFEFYRLIYMNKDVLSLFSNIVPYNKYDWSNRRVLVLKIKTKLSRY